MALRKNINLENGVSLSYHKISQVRVSVCDDVCILDIGYLSYASQNIRKTDVGLFIQRDSASFKIEPKELENVGILSLAYRKLKTLEKFENATNC